MLNNLRNQGGSDAHNFLRPSPQRSRSRPPPGRSRSRPPPGPTPPTHNIYTTSPHAPLHFPPLHSTSSTPPDNPPFSLPLAHGIGYPSVRATLLAVCPLTRAPRNGEKVGPSKLPSFSKPPYLAKRSPRELA